MKYPQCSLKMHEQYLAMKHKPSQYSCRDRDCVFHTPEFDGILPKGPYPPCLRMAARALLAGYPRIIAFYNPWIMYVTDLWWDSLSYKKVITMFWCTKHCYSDKYSIMIPNQSVQNLLVYIWYWLQYTYIWVMSEHHWDVSEADELLTWSFPLYRSVDS